MIIIYANVIEQNAGWGAEYFIDKSFHRKLVNTHNIDYRVNQFQLYERFRAIPGDFDAFLLQRGDYFPVDLVRCINRPKLFYFSELVAIRRDADHLFQSGLFDHYFVRSASCKAMLVKNNWVPEAKISILLSAFDPRTYRHMPVEKDIDVLFIGTLTTRRQKIFDSLKHVFPITIVSAFAEDAAQLYNRAKIVLNIHAQDFLDTETRIYEVLGSGGFVISERLSSESPFVNGSHLVEVDSVKDLVGEVGKYLRDEKSRERIAKQGHEFVHARHTYDHRAAEILVEIEKKLSSQSVRIEPVNKHCLERFRRLERVSRVRAGVIRIIRGVIHRILGS